MESAAAAPAVQVAINGEPRDVPPGCTVDALLAILSLSDRRVAVARNREVVPRSTYAQVAIEAGDRIEILEAVGGG